MKSKFLILAFLGLALSTHNASARWGVESGGGGDPQAVDFLLKTRAVAAWVKAGNASLQDDETQRVFATAEKLAELMDQSANTPIVMVDKNLRDASGASKVALYSVPNFKVEVTRSKWAQLSEEQKYVTAGLELLGLSQVGDRYNLAGQIQNDIARVVQVSALVGSRTDLRPADSVYLRLAQKFPEFNKQSGTSNEVKLQSLICSSSIQGNGSADVYTECIATTADGQSAARSAADLFQTLLISSKAVLDTNSEAGTVYLEIQDLECGSLQNGNDYYCSGKVMTPVAPE